MAIGGVRVRARTQGGLRAMSIDMGLRPGAKVKVEYKSLLKDGKWITRKVERGHREAAE